MIQKKTAQEILLRALMLLGLGVSVFLWREYTSESEMFCGAGGGCDEVRASSFANLLGVPTPALGILFFGGALLLAQLPSLHGLLRVWSIGGALAALGFIALQLFVVEAICQYCMITDVSALFIAGLIFVRSAPESSVSSFGATALGVAAAVSLSFVSIHQQETPLKEEVLASTIPAPIAEAQQPGKVTILQFIELGCDDCQASETDLRALTQQYDAEKLNIVRKIIPKGSQYAQAKAICCASQLGLDEQMIKEISVSASFSSLELESIAARFGADPLSYRDCFDSWGDDLVKKNSDDAQLLGVQRFPSVWVNTEQLREGFTPEEFQSCMERAFSAL